MRVASELQLEEEHLQVLVFLSVLIEALVSQAYLLISLLPLLLAALV